MPDKNSEYEEYEEFVKKSNEQWSNNMSNAVYNHKQLSPNQQSSNQLSSNQQSSNPLYMKR